MTDEEIVAELIYGVANGMTVRAVADECGISHTRVHALAKAHDIASSPEAISNAAASRAYQHWSDRDAVQPLDGVLTWN